MHMTGSASVSVDILVATPRTSFAVELLRSSDPEADNYDLSIPNVLRKMRCDAVLVLSRGVR